MNKSEVKQETELDTRSIEEIRTAKDQARIAAVEREGRERERNRILMEIREKDEEKAELMRARLRYKLSGNEEQAQYADEEIKRLERYLENLRTQLQGV